MTFALNPAAEPQVSAVGREREPLVVIDEVLADPQALVAEAAIATFAPAFGPAGGYPGIRAAAPLAYVERVARTIDPLLRQVFGLRDVRMARAECNFSIVTQRAHELAPAQRAPHVDTADPLQFAILHYLCGGEHGGTAFYRHRATGFEAITSERLEAYDAARAGEPAEEGYAVGDTSQFEQTASVGVRFNRLAVYRSRVLHSGIIPDDTALSEDPRRGRLTANIFLSYRRG